MLCRAACSAGKRLAPVASVAGYRHKHSLPDLPYDYDALEPHINAQIMQLHHSKHHAAYVNNLNTIEEKYREALAKGDVTTQITLQPALKFNGGGHINHSILWTNLSPSGDGEPKEEIVPGKQASHENKDKQQEETPGSEGCAKSFVFKQKQALYSSATLYITSFWKILDNYTTLSVAGCGGSGGELLEAIKRDFGSFEKFKEKLTAVCVGVQGSGWGWLGFNKEAGRLQIAACVNQDPLQGTTGLIPLLGIDVWEHAYYLQYKNVRPDYLKAIWNVINWENVTERYTACKK